MTGEESDEAPFQVQLGECSTTERANREIIRPQASQLTERNEPISAVCNTRSRYEAERSERENKKGDYIGKAEFPLSTTTCFSLLRLSQVTNVAGATAPLPSSNPSTRVHTIFGAWGWLACLTSWFNRSGYIADRYPHGPGYFSCRSTAKVDKSE